MGMELNEIQTRYMYMYVSRIIHMYLRYHTRVVGEMGERRGRRMRFVILTLNFDLIYLKIHVSELI